MRTVTLSPKEYLVFNALAKRAGEKFLLAKTRRKNIIKVEASIPFLDKYGY